MPKRHRKSKSGSSKRKSVKAYSGKKQAATRPATVNRNLKYAEKKSKDTQWTITGTLSPTETAIVPTTCLCTTSQGAGSDQRIGRRILVKSVYVRGRVFAPTTMTGAASFRMIIFQDKQPNGALAAPLDLLLANEFLSPLNLGNSKRFKVLADETLDGRTISVDTVEGINFERYIKTNIDVGYVNGAGAGTEADVLTNGIYAMVFFGGFGAGATAPTGKLWFRIRYTDY